MGLFSRRKKNLQAKSNAATDGIAGSVAVQKRLARLIAEAEEESKKALADLVSYKASAKQMEQQLARWQAEVERWEGRAVKAVKAGDDNLAVEALKEKKRCLEAAERARSDRDEAASLARDLGRSRKRFEIKLQILKLKQGTMAAQLVAAASGGGSPVAAEGEAWDQFRHLEEALDQEAIEAEVEALLLAEERGARSDSQRDMALGPSATGSDSVGTARGDPDRALAELKATLATKAGSKKSPR